MAETDSNVFLNGINNSIVDNLQAMSANVETNVAELTVMMKNIVDPNGGLKLSQSSLQDLIASGGFDRRSDYDRTSRRDVFEERRQTTRNNNGYNPDNFNRRNNFRRVDNVRDQWEQDMEDFYKRSSPKRRRGNSFDEFIDGWEDEFKKSLFGSIHPVKSILHDSIRTLADRLGLESTKDLPKAIGSRLGKLVGDRFKNSAIGGQLTAEWNGIIGGINNRIGGFFGRLGDRLEGLSPSEQVAQAAATQAAQADENGFRIFSSNQSNQAEGAQSGPISNTFRTASNIANAAANVATGGPNSIFGLVSSIADSIDGVDESNAVPVRIIDGSFAVPTRDHTNPSLNPSNLNPEDVTGSPATAENPFSVIGDAFLDLIPDLSNLGGTIGNVTSGLLGLNRAEGNATAIAESNATQLAQSAEAGAAGIGQVAQAAMGTASAAFPALTVAGIAATAALSLFGKTIGLGIKVFKKLVSWGIQPIKEGIKGFIDMMKTAATRQETINAKYLQHWQDRLKADITSLRQAAFNVIEESADRIENVWDNILTTVTATQGYSKEGVQELWGNYAERLTEEGLSSVVSSADIMEQLESILKSGLSGPVAEEFAYIATILNNAIPTEDFFQYASTYASIAANAMKAGLSQEEALTVANGQLESFASNLLYASREIAGGFTTSLTNASGLFEQSAKIALTSRTIDTSEISGVLTSVSAIVGATAPDLADSIVTAVVDAATGGNSANLTALRSMAGTGASNTAFLKALTEKPQEVFATLFRNLADLQNMSAENYMEVAEGLSEVFGLSMDAFARVDFAYLADAITAMNVNNSALDENMKKLESGQTTSTAAQLRMQKINEYMIEEGLAYVLDNEAAREIQRHMWEEQLAREITESTFAVEFAGTAYKSIQSIVNGLKRLFGVFDFSLFSNTVDEFELTALEMAIQQQEVKDVVQAGVIGKGNASAYKNLTTGYTDLNLTKSYIDLLTGEDNYTKQYAAVNTLREASKIKNGSVFDQIFGGTDAQRIIEKGLVEEGGKVLIADIKEDFESWLNPSEAEKSSWEQVEERNRALSEGAEAWRDYSDAERTAAEAKALREQQDQEKQNAKFIADQAKQLNKLIKSAKDTAKSVSAASPYTFSLVSKSVAEAIYAQAYNAIATQSTSAQASQVNSIVTAADKLTTDITEGIDKYISEQKQTSSMLNSLQKSEESHRDYYSQAELLDEVMKEQASTTGGSFADWTKEFEKKWNEENMLSMYPAGHMITSDEYRAKTLEEILADYDTTIDAVERLYYQQESIRTSAESKARSLHEVQFWEDMQNFATIDFPEYMREWQDYVNQWMEYYVRHTAYGRETSGAYVDENGNVLSEEAFNNGESIATWKMAQEAGQGDAILALAQTLTDNETYRNKSLQELKDPTLQTNAILSKILLTVEAIFQQNNETSIVSIPTSLSSLGLGVTNI